METDDKSPDPKPEIPASADSPSPAKLEVVAVRRIFNTDTRCERCGLYGVLEYPICEFTFNTGEKKLLHHECFKPLL